MEAQARVNPRAGKLRAVDLERRDPGYGRSQEGVGVRRTCVAEAQNHASAPCLLASRPCVTLQQLFTVNHLAPRRCGLAAFYPASRYASATLPDNVANGRNRARH